MQVPAAEYIEAAVDAVKKLPDVWRKDELSELKEALGAEELTELGVTALTPEMEAGYLLGIEVAREVIATSPIVLTHGIDPKAIL